MFKQRKLHKEIKKYINHKNVIVLTGPRQSGKTTLLRAFYDDLPDNQKLWFDLENPLHQKMFEDIDYDNIYKNLLDKGLIKSKKKYVFIDEIQNFPEITKIIKYLIDHYGIKFFVTGSSSFYMKNLFPESLSGRKFIFNLHPLDFEEFLLFKGLIKDLSVNIAIDLKAKTIFEFKKFQKEFDEYIEFGGFPQVVLARSKGEKNLILENIFKSFFEKDILNLADYQDVKEIRDLILLLSKRIGSKLDITKLASELGVNRYKIYSYLEFLEATFLLKLVSVYTKSIDKKIASGKKVYFLDTGLINKIVKLNEGELFENAVFNLLIRYGDISYFHVKTGHEIDFILNNEIALEVKSKATESDVLQLNRLSNQIGIVKKYIISKEYVENLDNIIYPQFL
jgi:hypothetical protein